MNNLKKTAVLGLVAIFAISMLMVPFTPITQVAPQVTTPMVSTPEEVKMDLKRFLDDRSVDGPLDSVLTAYKESGMVPNDVVTNADGAMGVLITVTPDTDIASMDDIVDVNWMVDFGSATVMSAYIGSVDAVIALEEHEGVVTAFADSLYRETKYNGVEPRPTIGVSPISSEPAAYATTVHIGAKAVVDLGIDGTGTRVGVIDTGTDFSHPDLVDAIDFGSDGLPTSYDPTGYGMGMTLYRVNLTTVDPDAWMAYSSWNVLSFTEGGKTYIDTSTYQHNGGSPYLNNQGGLYDLDFYIDAYLGAWWGNAYPNQANLTDYYYNVMRQPQEIPDPTTIAGGGQANVTLNATEGTWEMVPYACHGYVFQQRWDPYIKLFAPTLVVNSTKIVVDWNTARAWSDFWSSNIDRGLYDFNETATWTYYNNTGDWSYADDLAAGDYYMADGTVAHTNMYHDYGDGARFGLGVLAHVWEGNIFGLGMIDGIALGGRAIGIMYDGDSHGTFVSGQIASRGVTQYPVGLNGTMEYLPGVAPDSTLMGVSTVGLASEFNSMLWAAGFDFNGTSGYFEWNWDSGHQMHITSNSWGWVTPQYYELYGQYSLLYAAMATPGYFNATYPGMIQCFSSGNSGPGYGTTTPPRAPQLIAVGASTSYHTFENAYGPDQGFDQIADFSSRGPLTLGYGKPDVLAPGRNNWGLIPMYGDTFGFSGFDGTAVYAGTSMACPMVAGVAALLQEAFVVNTGDIARPDVVKTLIQSTADPIGMDGFSMGHGVVNALAAYEYIKSGQGYWFYTMDSMANWATATTEAWQYRMNPYDVDNFINTTTPPTDFADANLYFGLVAPGTEVQMTVEGSFVSSNWGWSAHYYREFETTQFEYNTSIYNETISTGSDSTKAGYILLDTLMEAANAGSWTDFANAPYGTIWISGDQATFEDDSMWAFVFDWLDNDPANGVPDYYNTTTGEGDELTRIQYAGGTGNVLKIDLSHPDGIGNLFPNQPIIMAHDDNIWSWPYTDGITLDVKVTTWEIATDPNVVINPLGDDANVTLVAPAVAGIHQGWVRADLGNGTIKDLPYSYSVYDTYDTAGDVLTLADGAGAEWTPYEPGIIAAGFDSYYSTRSADHHSIVVDMTDATVNYFAARVEWANADTDMDVAVVAMTGVELAHSGDSVKATDTSALAIADVGGTTGMYIIYTTMNEMEGPTPEPYTLTVVGYDDLNEPVLTLSWYSRDSPTQTVFTSGDTIAGDHVVVNATWTDGVNPGMPEFSITSTELKVLYGTLFYEEGPMVHASDPGGQFDGIIDPSNFAWVTVPDLNAGDTARIVVDFDTSDADVMAWPPSIPMEARTYANNIVDMASGDHPETDTIVLPEDGDYAFGIMDFTNEGGDYYITVDTRLGLEPARVYDNTIELDTYYLLANQTYGILVDSDTGTNLRFSEEIPAVTIGNFFAPVVTVPAPVATAGDADVFDITWSSTDLNADDTTYYSLWLSNNDGVSYMLLAQNLTVTSYQWDSSGWLEDSYMVRVRAYSLDFTTAAGGADVSDPPAGYWPGDFGDGFSPAFDAGDVPPPDTTPANTTTSDDGGGGVAPPIDPLLIGLIGGIGVGVVIILILFLIRKK